MATITIPLDARVAEGDRVEMTKGDARVSDVIDANGALSELRYIRSYWADLGWEVTTQRDVPDLPTEPAVVFRAEAMGSLGTLVSVLRNGSIEYVDKDGNRYSAAAIEPGTVELATITWGTEA